MGPKNDCGILVVGLGNPGKKYENTAHNLGFMVLDGLVESLGLTWVKGDSGWQASTDVSGRSVFMFKPGVDVNHSGLALKAFIEQSGREFASIVVVHDDLDLPLGVIRVKRRGGNSGHNGVRSIIDELGTDKFDRQRIGARPDGDTRPSQKIVLCKFSKEQKKLVSEVIDKAANTLSVFCKASQNQ